MTDDDDIGTLLHLATRDEPPAAAGAPEVFRRAGSIQRRRRVATGLAGIATLGVLTAGGVALAGQFGSSGDTPVATLPAAPGSVAPAPSSSTTGAGSIPPAAALSTLRSLLPAGSQVSGSSKAADFARLVLLDGQGRSTVEVNVQPDYQGGAGKTNGTSVFDCTTRAVPPGAQCVVTTLADRTKVVTIDGPAGEPGAPAVTMRQVDVLTPDDVRVVVSVWNAVDVQRGPTTRSTPALTTGQLQAMATSGRWAVARAGTGGAHN